MAHLKTSTMSQKLAISLFSLLLLLAFSLSDPDPIQDFCIPDPGPNPIQLTHLPTYPCKNPLNVTPSDFISTLIKSPGPFSTSIGFAGTSVTPVQFPGLNTLGMSFARADFQPDGLNPPHYHPRATETALVVEGSLYSGFVDSTGRLYAKVIQKGEVMVFPRGMVHFQMNIGENVATIFGSFNSENPGVVRLPVTVFGSGIREELLEKAFDLSPKEVERLKKRFGSN